MTLPALASLAAVPRETLLTLGLALGMLFVAMGGSWLITRKKTIEERRFWRLTIRNVAAVGFVLGLSIIWRSHLQSVMVVLSAATAGILIAMREAVVSLLAFWVRMVKRHYNLGDFIEIDGIRGEVMDITWLYTMLAETGPGKDSLTYSGRVVQIPNNRMLIAPLFVDNLTGSYGAHLVQITLRDDQDTLAAEAALLDAAQQVCAPYRADAEQHMVHLREAHAIDTPSVAPRVQIRFNDEGGGVLVLRIVVPARDKLRAEQLILREYLRQTQTATAVPRVPMGGSKNAKSNRQKR